MFLAVFDDLKSFTKKLTTANVKPRIDSALFQSLRLAAAITAMACVLATARNYIGDNINCVSADMGEQEMGAVESYCFIASTFTLSNLTLPAQQSQPGVGPKPRYEVMPSGLERASSQEEEGITVHAYYQWVPFMLALQSLMLYMPYALWNNKEGGYLDTLLGGTHRVHVDKSEAAEKSKKSAAVFRYTMKNNNFSYLVSFLLCELLGTVVAITNLFITNTFLGGKFFYFGKGAMSYLTHSATDPNNPLNEVFPKVGKCTWRMFGPSGTMQVKDALCVLPLNIVNEKTYVVLWLTYITLCVLTGLFMLYHLFLFILPRRLDYIIRNRIKSNGDLAQVRELLNQCEQGDKFILWGLQEYIVGFNSWIADVLAEKQG